MSLYSPWDSFLAKIAINPDLAPWLKVLPSQIERFMESGEGKIFQDWTRRFRRFKGRTTSEANLSSNTVTFGHSENISEGEKVGIEKLLQEFMPWRKGPYEIFNVPVPTEWESWMKWDRLHPHITPLKGRTVLDVGAGNGYHMWRMLGDGAKEVVGIEPSEIFLSQFELFHSRFCNPEFSDRINLLPLIMEDLPPLSAFDTVFSMGVLDHRRSPADHLIQLNNALKPNGELVLETIVIDGDENTVLLPRDRYAKMANIWYIPSPEHLKVLLSRTGFTDIKLVSVSRTEITEQHRTPLMQFESLQDYLDPKDNTKTIEGYQAPTRAIFVARKEQAGN